MHYPVLCKQVWKRHSGVAHYGLACGQERAGQEGVGREGVGREGLELKDAVLQRRGDALSAREHQSVHGDAVSI